MTTVNIRFINSPGLVSKGINWVTNSLWDHAEFCLPEGYLGAHAGSGIELRPLDYCKPSRERRYAIPCEDSDAILASAKARVGTKYDYLDIAGLFFHDRRLHENSREICSAFVFDECFKGGLMLLNCLPDYGYLITPETLHLSSKLIGNAY